MPFSASKIILSRLAIIRFLYWFTLTQCIIQHTINAIFANPPITGIKLQRRKIFFELPIP